MHNQQSKKLSPNAGGRCTKKTTNKAKIDKKCDLRPRGIIEDMELLRPIYTETSAYGHFGRENPDFDWEKTGIL